MTALETAVVIYLDTYRRARDAKRPVQCRDEELLCVNWSPAFGAIAIACYQTPQELSPQLPDERAEVNPAFIRRVHELASQI